MTEIDRPSDEELVAFLDDELAPEASAHLVDAIQADPETNRRLAMLAAGGDVRPAFDALLDAAPHDRLEGILAAALARQEVTPNAGTPLLAANSNRQSVPWLRIAAALVLFAAGGLAGGLVATSLTTAPDSPQILTAGHENWRDAVAEYWLLTTAETLAITPPAELAKAQLAAAGRGLGLDLAAALAPPPALSFRGAQLYEFQGRPLTQIAYLDPEQGPIAYCIIKAASDKSVPMTDETLDGFNIVHWASGGHARMLIGRAPPETLRAYAQQFAARAG